MLHLYSLNGYDIAIDQNSGSIHVLDEDTARVLSCFDAETGVMNGTPEENGLTDIEGLDDILSDIEELKEDGKLFSEDIFRPMADDFKKKQSVLKAMCLHVAHACNMDCEYCFAGKGEYHGDAGLMSYETGKKAIDWLVENSPGRRNLEVDFFGGEPLLNWQVVKDLVAYGRSIEKEAGKNFRFTLTTNGLLVDDDVIEFSNREMSNVVLSLDGCRETNDRMRRMKDGSGTYDHIVGKFKRFADARGPKEYYMRGTYTKHDLEFTDEILHMADLGFRELSMEPVVAPPEADYALSMDDAPVLCEQYEKLAKAMIERRREGRPFEFYHYMVDLEGGPCISKRISGCGVGTEYVAVTPEGDIYPCHQFVGETDFIMGNLDEGITHPEVREIFRSCNIYSHDECTDCFAKLYCSGGCAANAYHATGSVDGVYELGCTLHKKRIECAVMMKACEAEDAAGEDE